jgi:hypothetical protein
MDKADGPEEFFVDVDEAAEGLEVVHPVVAEVVLILAFSARFGI